MVPALCRYVSSLSVFGLSQSGLIGGAAAVVVRRGGRGRGDGDSLKMGASLGKLEEEGW